MITTKFTTRVALRVTTASGQVHDIEEVASIEVTAMKSTPRAAPKPKGEQTYSAADVTDDDVKRLLAGEFDDAECRLRPRQDRLCKQLAYMMRRCFKLDAPPVFTAADAGRVAQALAQQTKPSVLALALRGASMDSFWREKRGIPFHALVRDAQALAAKARDGNSDPRSALKRLLPGIAALDPLAHAEITEGLPSMTREQATTTATEWSARIKRAKETAA